MWASRKILLRNEFNCVAHCGFISNSFYFDEPSIFDPLIPLRSLLLSLASFPGVPTSLYQTLDELSMRKTEARTLEPNLMIHPLCKNSSEYISSTPNLRRDKNQRGFQSWSISPFRGHKQRLRVCASALLRDTQIINLMN